MTDALLLLLDRHAHPGTLEDTAFAALQLKGVTHVARLGEDATINIAQYREGLDIALRRMEEARFIPAEVYDDGA